MVIAQEELARIHHNQRPSADQSVEIHHHESLGLTGGVVSTVAQESYDHNQRLQSVTDSAVSNAGADFGDFFAEVDATPTATLQAHATSCDCGACGQQMQEQNTASESRAYHAAAQSSSQDQQVAQSFFLQPEQVAEAVVTTSNAVIAAGTEFGDFFASLDAAPTATLQAHATSCDCGACGQQMHEQNAVSESRANSSVENSSSKDQDVAAEFFQRSEAMGHSTAVNSSVGSASTTDFGDFFAEVDAAPASTLQAHATSCDCGACGQQMQEQNAVSESRANEAAASSIGKDQQTAAGLFSASEQNVQSPITTNVLGATPAADFSDFFAEVEATPASTVQPHSTSCDCGACGLQMQEQDSSSARLADLATRGSSPGDEKVAARLFDGSTQKSERTETLSRPDVKGISSFDNKTTVDLRSMHLDEKRSVAAQPLRSSNNQKELLSSPVQRATSNRLKGLVEQRQHSAAEAALRNSTARSGIPLGVRSSLHSSLSESSRLANVPPQNGHLGTGRNRSSGQPLQQTLVNYQKFNHMNRHLKVAPLLDRSRLAGATDQSRRELPERRHSGNSALKQNIEASPRRLQVQTLGEHKRQSGRTIRVLERGHEITGNRKDGGRFERYTRELQSAIRELLKQAKVEQKFQQISRYSVEKQHTLTLPRLSAHANRLLDLLNRSLPSGMSKFSREEAHSLQRILRGARSQKEVLQLLTKAAREKASSSLPHSLRDTSRRSAMRSGAIQSLSFRTRDLQQAQRALHAVRTALQRAALLSANLVSKNERRASMQGRHLEMRTERAAARKMLLSLQSNSPKVQREILHAALRPQRVELLERARSFRETPRYQLHRLVAKERVLERRMARDQVGVKGGVTRKESLPRFQQSRQRLVSELLRQASPRFKLQVQPAQRTHGTSQPGPQAKTPIRELPRESSRSDEQVAQLIHDLIRAQGTGKARRIRTQDSPELWVHNLTYLERVREEIDLSGVIVTEDTRQMRDELKQKIEERRTQSRRGSNSSQIVQILEMGSEIGLSVPSLAQKASADPSGTPVLKSRGGAIRSLDHFQSETDDEDAENRRVTSFRR